MSFTSLFLFFFGAIGVFNSFIISLYFTFYKNPKQLSNVLFGLLLFFLSERALRSLIYFFSPALPNFYSESDAIAFVFIGPFLYLYILSVLKPTSKIVKYWRYYILGWILIAIATHLIYPFKGDQVFWKEYILSAINIQWLTYILVSGWIFIKSLSTKNKKNHSTNTWLTLLLLSVLILWLVYFFVSFSFFVIGSITFSVIFYVFYVFFLFKKKERFQIFNDGKKYTSKKIDASKASLLVNELNVILLKQKLYKNSNIKSSDIAKQLNISTHQFSQLLNDNLKKSFSTFINEYRIEEAKQLIKSNTKYTLDAIGNESGFNSKSTFYTSFKRLVGMTPSKYREQLFSSKL